MTTTKKIIKKESDNEIKYLKPKSIGKYEGEKLYEINYETDELDQYCVTKSGKIYNKKIGKFCETRIINGYHVFNLKYTLHRLIAMTFIDNVHARPYVNHIDENKENNSVDNLEWVTQKENTERHTKITSHSRKVKQIDVKTNKIVKEFEQITHAAESIGLSRRAIQLVLTGKNKTAGGYFWEYSDESNYADNVSKTDLESKNIMKVYDYVNYHVYDDGRIYNDSTKKFLKPVLNAAKRAYVTLCKSIDGKSEKKNRYIHTIVADHFLPNKPHAQSEVRHISNDLTDNNVKNLKWSNGIQKSAVIMPKVVQKNNDLIENKVVKKKIVKNI